LLTILNEYVELTANCRFNNAELSIFAKFLHYALTAYHELIEYIHGAVIDDINKVCLNFNPNTCIKCTNPNTLLLADTNTDVSRISYEKMQQLLTTSPSAFRIISSHTPVRQLISKGQCVER